MNRTVKRSIIGILVSALLVIFDQVTKSLAVTHLKGQDAFVIWDGVFELPIWKTTVQLSELCRDKK